MSCRGRRHSRLVRAAVGKTSCAGREQQEYSVGDTTNEAEPACHGQPKQEFPWVLAETGNHFGRLVVR